MDYANTSTRGIAREWRPLDPKFNRDPVKAFRLFFTHTFIVLESSRAGFTSQITVAA